MHRDPVAEASSLSAAALATGPSARGSGCRTEAMGEGDRSTPGTSTSSLRGSGQVRLCPPPRSESVAVAIVEAVSSVVNWRID